MPMSDLKLKSDIDLKMNVYFRNIRSTAELEGNLKFFKLLIPPILPGFIDNICSKRCIKTVYLSSDSYTYFYDFFSNKNDLHL